MSIWGCGSPATYFQPSAAAGFIYCRTQEWDLHSPSPTGFIYLEFSSIQPYPPFAIAFFLFRVHEGMCPSPHSVVECATLQPPLETFPSPSTQGEVALPPPPPAGLFIYHSMRPSLLRVFFFSAACLFRLVFSLFSLGGGQSVQGAMLIWPRVVCGSTVYCLAHLVVCFSQSRSWRLEAQEPFWFLCLM
jgi:hypothetical protein